MSQQVTILHVSVSGGFSGTERIVCELAERSRGEGIATGVVVPVRPALDGMARRLEAAGVTVFRTGDLFAADRGLPGSFATFWKLFRAVRPRVVHFHIPWVPSAWEAVIAARLAGVPVVLRTEHNPITAPLPLAQRAKLRITDLAAHHVVFVSKGNAERHRANGRGWLRRWSIVPNGIPAAPAPPATRDELRAILGAPPGATIAAMVGHLEERKGPIDFVRAAAAAVDAGSELHFAVFGDGPLRAEAEALAGVLGIAGRVHFAGHRPDVRRLLPACDIFIQPSHFEGLSIAMLEALAAGLPMVTTRVEGIDEVLRGGDAIVCEVRDIQGLARGMRDLERDPGRRAELAAATRARVLESFSAEAMWAAYRALYTQLGAPITAKGEDAWLTHPVSQSSSQR
ncbi:MAG: glycosyltransferase [Dehalococcoidia bacterium]|nr:glycosyltransferase [Dehalococcoidia bacterium]